MTIVRYLYALVLIVWVGGMVVLGSIVAPTTFGVLQAREPSVGRELAGAVFGQALGRFHLVAYICGFVMLVTLGLEYAMGHRPFGYVARQVITLAMLLIALYSGVPLTRRLDHIHAQIGGPIDRLAPTDPLRVEFDRLHQRSVTLMTVNVLGGLVLVYFLAKR